MNTEQKAEAYDRLLTLLGHFQDGSQEHVYIVMDDATRNVIVSRGKHCGHWGYSLDEALKKAQPGWCCEKGQRQSLSVCDDCDGTLGSQPR